MIKKVDKGFSLVEIIITLALMAIVTLFAVSYYSSVKSAELKKGTKTINSQISELRTEAMSKQYDWKLEVTKESSGYVSTISYEKITIDPTTGVVTNETITEDEKKLGKKITITCDNGSSEVEIDGDCKILIEFNKSSGTFKTASCVKISDGTSFDIDEINIKQGSSDKQIKLIRLTGKHYID